MRDKTQGTPSAEHNRLPTTAIIMATYNGEAFVGEQLASFARQTVLPGKLVISDDGSTDDTVAIVRDFARTAPFPVDFQVNVRNLGYSNNFISTSSRSNADLLFFSDQDDIWADDKIERLSSIAARQPYFVLSHDRSFYYPDKPECNRESHFQILDDLHLPRAITPSGCCMAVKAAFFTQWGWPKLEPNIHHDTWIALLSTAFRQRDYVDVPLIRYRKHANNTTNWMPSYEDLVRTKPEQLGTSKGPSDVELMIEVLIRPWNLHWTNELIKVAKRHHRPEQKALLQSFIFALEENAAWYKAQGIRPSRSRHSFLRRSVQVAKKLVNHARAN